MFKMLKLLRIFRLLRYINLWEQVYEDNYDQIQFVVNLLTKLALLLLNMHIFACMHVYLAVDDFGNITKDSWLDGHPAISPEFVRNLKSSVGMRDTLRVYKWALFKSLSHMFCIGYGLNAPNNHQEMLLAVISILFGAINFAYVLSVIISACQDLHRGERIYTQKYNQLTQYMIYRKLPFELQERMYLYYEYRFQGKVFDEAQVLQELNPVLRKTVVKYNQKWLIKSAPMFEDTSDEFKNLIAEALKFELYLPDDILFSEGDRATEIYFLARGTVSIVSQAEIVGRKIDGEVFGELPMILPDINRLCTAVCDTCSHIYELELSISTKFAASLKKTTLKF